MKIFNLNNETIIKEFFSYLTEEQKFEKKIEKSVLKIFNRIKKSGFEGLRYYSKKFDDFDLTYDNFIVKKDEIDQLAKKIEPKLEKALKTAVKRISDFHKNELLESFAIKDKDNNRMGQKIIPLDSCAIYIPGGEALYPSTLYMTAIPAIIAGVKRIVLLSPPKTFERSSEIAKLIQILGIKEVYRIGGPQAIFAATYGIEPMQAVDKIAGPGNAYVAKAKQIVYGKVDIDMIAGPSEILIIADTNDAKDIHLIASDLLSQAEHGPAGYTRSILIGYEKNYLIKIRDETYRQAGNLPDKQKNIAIRSLDAKGMIVICKNVSECVEISNKIAPEHLEIFSLKPYPLLDKIRNAGSIFLGKNTPESAGDYLAGPNHVLPTSGTARFFSPLGVYDFQKRLSWIEFSNRAIRKYSMEIALIARAEGLEAHARSAEIRLNNK